MELELIRTYYDRGTNGALLLKGEQICATIELPWKNNQHRISCIPEGRYALKKRYSPKHGWHLELMEVPNRQWILIHPANNAVTELEGCIAPVDVLTASGRGLGSRVAFNRLTALVFPVLNRQEVVWLNINGHDGA